MEEPQFQPLPVQLDPQTDSVLEQRIAIPYTTTLPSFTPRVNGVRRVYFDGTDYWLYLYANGAWRSQKLGVSGGTPGGSDTQVQFNDGGSFGGNSKFTFNKTTGSINFGPVNSATGTISTSNATLASASGTTLQLFSGNGNTTGSGGSINLGCGQGGLSSGVGGESNIVGGNGGSPNGRGGPVYITGGAGVGSGAGGEINVTAGDGGATGTGGDVGITPGAKGASGGTPGDIKLNAVVLATTVNGGFPRIPTCAGAPTGTPVGNGAMIYDTTNNKLYIYNGAWKSATFA